MKNRRLRWLLGTIALLIIFWGILFYPYKVLIYPALPHITILKRALGILLLSCMMCLYRIMKGPTAPDRAVAIDILGILIGGFCAVLSIPTGRTWYIDIGIAWSLQSFIGTLALAKYLEGKNLDE